MRLRITLYNDISYVVINEPDGWKEAIIRLERDKMGHSLIQYFEGSFLFYGDNGVVNGGFTFIKQTEIDYGPDANLRAVIELSVDDVTYSTIHDGQFKLSEVEETPDNKIKVPIIRDDFWAKFVARMETPVDIQSPTDLDDNAASILDETRIKLTPQIIDALHYSVEERGRYILDDLEYMQYVPDKVVSDELHEFYIIPNFANDEVPVWIFEVEYAGLMEIDIRIEYSKAVFVPNDGHENPRTIFDWYIQKNEDTPIEFSYVAMVYHDESVYEHWSIFKPTVNPDEVNTAVATYVANLDLLKGDIIRVYMRRDTAVNENIAIWGTDGLHVTPTGVEAVSFSCARAAGMVEVPTYFRFLQKTVYPENEANGFLLHDVGGQIVDRITGTSQRFYSEYLGGFLTKYKAYPQDGCRWNNYLLRGLQAREYTLEEKPFYISFKKWWDGIDPILCLGFGYEDINGEQMIVVRRKEDYYDNSGRSIDFSNVRDIVRTYDNEVIYNKIEIGYERWESEDVSGIDDPQSKHTYASRFKKIGKAISLFSDFIGASLALETTRRATREKSADYKFDNEIFIVAINPTPVEDSPELSPDIITFVPELSENFSSVTSLLNYETRYNIELTPARNFLRWVKFLQGCLQHYVGSLFKFTSGEGNFDMTSTMITACDDSSYTEDLAENEDITVTDEFIHLCYSYEVNIPMEYTEFETIINNRTKPVGISQSATNHKSLFINDLSYSIAKGEATIIGWSREFIDITVQEDGTASRDCNPATADCEDAITDVFGEYLTTTTGACITA